MSWLHSCLCLALFAEASRAVVRAAWLMEAWEPLTENCSPYVGASHCFAHWFQRLKDV